MLAMSRKYRRDLKFMSSYILLEMSLRNKVKEHPNVSFVEFVYFVNSNIESEVT